MKRRSFLVIGCLLFVSVSTFAQSRWKAYDSIYFENLFLPNFSNLLMPKGYAEVLLSNSFLTANTGWRTAHGAKFDLNARYSYNYVTAIGNLGVSKSGRFNAGVELHYAIGYHDSDPKSAPMELFKGAPAGFVERSRAVTTVGPRIKWRPFKNNLHFVYITTLQLPVLHNAKKEGLLGQQRIQWGNQFLYSFSLGKKVVLFAQDDLYIYFGEGTNAYNSYYNGLTFSSYFLITRHFFPFVSAGYNAGYGTDIATKNFQNQFQAIPLGAGVQYQHSMRFTINVYYNSYAWAQSYQDWHTLNLGFRGVF